MGRPGNAAEQETGKVCIRNRNTHGYNSRKASCDKHANALELDVKTGEPTGNYKFDFGNYTHGNLTVTPEKASDADHYVSINNSSIHAYENEKHEVSANGGSLELSVDSSNTFQNVSVKAYDKANNEATTASVDVLVSANTWVQFYNNKPVFYGTIGGGVAAVAAAVAAGVHFSGAAAGTAAAAGKTAAGAGIFLAGKKRKKDEE